MTKEEFKIHEEKYDVLLKHIDDIIQYAPFIYSIQLHALFLKIHFNKFRNRMRCWFG
jgi:hypothetical protein